MKKLIFAIIACGLFSLGQAQNRLIKGVVTTFDEISVIGASVRVSSTKQIVETDSLGQFTVEVAPKDKLKISAHGFSSRAVKLDEQIKFVAVNLFLKPGEKARTYAVGYGHVSDAEKLNAVSQVRDDDANFAQYASIYDLIEGRFPGVDVFDNGDVVVRGPNSMNSDNCALFVVDGIVVDKTTFAALTPAAIKSIDVVKDSGTAVYGTRGGNGVVLVETKNGSE
ncbi:TonB-dependent receptor plug domain-containing protein [Mangrovibacterium sp.]|uniref:TonB-dependent receptor plug domain-containing protein n=1 Tax=Mangrovibacterium sp. TaxID=1961364 RepID=UPI00356136AD